MSLESFEIDFIKDILKIGKTDRENIRDKLPRDVFDFLKQNDNLRTVIDRIIHRKKTKESPCNYLC